MGLTAINNFFVPNCINNNNNKKKKGFIKKKA
jgi:hypothetical protein